MAIEIRNSKGQLAELAEDTVINIERNNPLFNDDDKLFSDITFPFTLPVTPSNKIFFERGEIIDAENRVYRQDVSLTVDGIYFFGGSLRYAYKDENYEALLLVNYASLADKTKKVKINEIFVEDGFDVNVDLMKIVCENPKNYNYSFFTIYNDFWTGAAVIGNPYVNYWDHANQVFVMTSIDPPRPVNRPISAYFKLSFVIKKICKYLGFDCIGNFFSSKNADEIFIYTNTYCYARIGTSNIYLPEISIADFFKIIRTRFRISVSFDFFTKLASITSAEINLNTEVQQDISNYVSNIEAIELNEVEGYTVLLKPDTTDKLFEDPNNAGKYIATNKLTFGSGVKNIEINASTLKERIIAENRKMPYTSQKILPYQKYYSLRFIRYKGFKVLTDGKKWPDAESLELNSDDSRWFDMLSQGKNVIMNCIIPTNVIANLDVNKITQAISNEGTFFKCLPKKIEYTLGESSELINVKITALFLTYIKSTAVISPIINEQEEPQNEYFLIKALFSENVFSSIEVNLVYRAGMNVRQPDGSLRTLTTDEIKTVSLERSTDANRVGGTAGYAERYKQWIYSDYYYIQIRCSIAPQYLIFDGKKIYFTQHSSGYWFADPFFAIVGVHLDSTNLWLKF